MYRVVTTNSQPEMVVVTMSLGEGLVYKRLARGCLDLIAVGSEGP